MTRRLSPNFSADTYVGYLPYIFEQYFDFQDRCDLMLPGIGRYLGIPTLSRY